MNEQVQQQIVALVQAAMQGDQQARQQIQQIMQAAQQGDQQAIQIAQLIQQVVQQMQQQQGVQSAKFGAKLNYIKHLRGQCPAGYEMQYYKSGGRLCKKCAKKQNGGDVNRTASSSTGQDAINEFRCGSKMKKHQNGGNIDKLLQWNKDIEKKAQNKKTADQFEKNANKKQPESEKDTPNVLKKEKCGGKVKKKAVGGAIDNKELPISCPCHKKKVRKGEDGLKTAKLKQNNPFARKYENDKGFWASPDSTGTYKDKGFYPQMTDQQKRAADKWRQKQGDQIIQNMNSGNKSVEKGDDGLVLDVTYPATKQVDLGDRIVQITGNGLYPVFNEQTGKWVGYPDLATADSMSYVFNGPQPGDEMENWGAIVGKTYKPDRQNKTYKKAKEVADNQKKK